MNITVSNSATVPIRCKGKKSEALIIRQQGGIGDILNTRMLFQDLKAKLRKKITYAIPPEFFPLVADHPHIDRVVNYLETEREGFGFCKDITNKCGEYEQAKAPDVDMHRSDIWARHIGIELKHHDMLINFSREELRFASQVLENVAKPIVAIQPISFHPSKDWPLDRWQELVDAIVNDYGFGVVCFHSQSLPLRNVLMLGGNINLREWMTITSLCDYVITVATAMFCLANGLHKPTVAIFGCEDLDIYGKYFSEMIPIQRHRKNGDGWPDCPCWSAWKECKRNNGKENVFPPPCLDDINVSEVIEGFKRCLKIKVPKD